MELVELCLLLEELEPLGGLLEALFQLADPLVEDGIVRGLVVGDVCERDSALGILPGAPAAP